MRRLLRSRLLRSRLLRSRRRLFERLETRNLLSVGDVNGDLLFDSSDLTVVFQRGEYEDAVECNSTYDEGDWNGDCEFDSRDLVTVFVAGTYQNVVYPRLLFGPDAVADLQTKTKLPKFADMFAREVLQVSRLLDVDYAEPSFLERQKSLDASRFAFLTLMLDESVPERALFAAKAREILRSINDGTWDATPVQGSHHADFNGGKDLHHYFAGSTLQNYSVTYDWLVGAGELAGVDRAEARFRLLRLAQLEHEIQLTPLDIVDRSEYAQRKSNYGFRSLAGVGTVALAFPDQRGLIADPQNRLVSSAVAPFNSDEVLERVLHELFVEITTDSTSNPIDIGWVQHYISSDGYYGEGYTYQNDIFRVFAPFLVALDHAGGRDFISEHGEFDGRIARIFINDARVILPDFQHPVVGDSFAGKYFDYPDQSLTAKSSRSSSKVLSVKN